MQKGAILLKVLGIFLACWLGLGSVYQTRAATPQAPGTEATPAASTQKKPKVAILATGGTIAGQAGSAAQLTGYKPGVLTPEQLIAAVPALSDFADITAEQIANIGSQNMTIDVWLKLANRINELLAGDVDGIVVTHGTDSMEETAYFLNLVTKSKKPVILVGAMRPATAISADGPLNLLQAVQVAGDPNSRDRGVLLVLNGEINGARDVTKTNTTQPETFRSHDLGFLGYVIDNKPEFYRATTRKHTADTEFDIKGLTSLPVVDIVYNYVDPRVSALKGILADNPDGIVAAGMGDGSQFKDIKSALAEAAKKGIPVVRSSRTGSGIVTTRQNYDGEFKLLAGDNLSPQKARILLMLALTKTKSPEEIARIFKTY